MKALNDGQQARKDILTAAYVNGISEDTLNRARRALNIKTVTKGFDKKSTFWKLPENPAGMVIQLFDDTPNPFGDDNV